MSYRITPLTVLRASNPAKFRIKMQGYITKHRGKLTHVASDIGVGYTTVKRWVLGDVKLKRFLENVRRSAP